MLEQRALDWLESLPLGPSDELLAQLTEAALGQGQRKDVMSGTWLGHALHPPLTDLTLGAWVGASLLDVFPAPFSRRAAQRLVALGILSSVPTALAGMADWIDTTGETRQLGTLHAVGNIGVLGLYAASWAARRTGRHGAGRTLGLTAITLALGTAWLGGHLLMRKGVGVDNTAFLPLPSDWQEVAAESDLADGGVLHAEVGGVGILLSRRDGAVHAIANRCSHRGGPLHEGSIDEATVTCPWHGSTFCLDDGSIDSGPATAPQPVLETRLRDGRIEVRASG